MSKKNEIPKNIQKLKEQIELGNNLIDYFLVCGAQPSSGLLLKELFNFYDNKKKFIPMLSKLFKPQILSKFPDFDKSYNIIDKDIINYCFPKGFKPIYDSNLEKHHKKKEIFSIIIDNNLFSSEYSQKYVTCLVFYESMAQYKSLYDNILQVNNNLDIKKNDSSEEKMSVNNQSMKISNENDILSNSDKSIFKSNLTEMKDKTKTYKLKYYYIPKCICIVSIHPYINLFKKILISIYNYSLSTQEIPLEKIIANLLIEVPIPPRGLYTIDFYLLNKVITLKRAENNKLLLSELDLRIFHNNIEFNIIIDVLKHILFGSKIIFFSKDLNKLCETILSFLSLIFPFKYPFQIISHLIKENYIILESISPYIIGINEVYNSQFFEKNNIVLDNNTFYVVDLDNNVSELKTDEIIPDFPEKLINELEKKIKIIEKNIDNNNKNFEEFNKNYQDIYLYFMCELIRNYEDYLNLNYYKNTDDNYDSIETLFNCEQFIKSHSSKDIPFYTKFVTESQLFADFIYKRMITKNNQEIIEILFVNDILAKISNENNFFSKEKLEIYNSNKYQHINKYDSPQPKKLLEKEKKLIKENLDQLKFYY